MNRHHGKHQLQRGNIIRELARRGLLLAPLDAVVVLGLGQARGGGGGACEAAFFDDGLDDAAGFGELLACFAAGGEEPVADAAEGLGEQAEVGGGEEEGHCVVDGDADPLGGS